MASTRLKAATEASSATHPDQPARCQNQSVTVAPAAPPDTPDGKRDRARVAVHGPSFQKALKAGVKIVFGTDAGSFEWTDPNSPIAAEFARMVEFGMTPAQAIKSATSVPAVMLGMEGQIGVVAPGAFADIIAVQGDPLRDGNALKNIVFVVKDGKVFKNELR
jgi:imidazolonepropionase-like amidohydrolase